MALRAFHANPSIGGFGNENTTTAATAALLLGGPRRGNVKKDNPANAVTDGSSGGDALCQIVKELVDNAVDACELARQQISGDNKVYRVKVEIIPYTNVDNDDTLQITVSDNGGGMKDIQACVNAFQSSKGNDDTNTAGRYGIGLTLCLLHAQRLVPGTYSCITSATQEARTFQRALYFVNTAGDTVECHREEEVPKKTAEESGTCVSVLVPGGQTAEAAWPRLESYLKRFQLSPVECSIEVLAPTISSMPIHISRRTRTSVNSSQDKSSDNKGELLEGLDSFGGEDDSVEDLESLTPKNPDAFLSERKLLQTAAHKYGFFRLPVKLQNVAYCEHRIRIPGMDPSVGNHSPKLTVAVLVSPHEEDPNDDQSSTACLELVRMVNSVPLLDSAESFACGLVKALHKTVVWSSFGLTILGSSSAEKESWSNKFSIRDSDQVAPFFRSHTHQQWEEQQEESQGDPDGEQPEDEAEGRSKKKRGRNSARSMLPAKVRLSKILMVVNICAAPSTLPLPSLSKGRLPVNHLPITQAFQLGLRDCLRSLQISSPGLLLTASQLRTVERDVRYIPLMASAAAGILGRMLDRSKQQRLLRKVQHMYTEDHQSDADPLIHQDERSLGADELVRTIEHRTSYAIKLVEEAKKQTQKKKKKSEKKSDDANDLSDLENFDVCSQNSDPGPKSDDEAPSKQVPTVTAESQSFDSEDSLAEESSVSTPSVSEVPKPIMAAPEGASDDDDEWW